VCTACYYTYDSTKNQTNGVNKTDKIKDLNYFEEPYLNSLNPEALKLYKESYWWNDLIENNPNNPNIEEQFRYNINLMEVMNWIII
jgi:hypothetical protein